MEAERRGVPVEVDAAAQDVGGWGVRQRGCGGRQHVAWQGQRALGGDRWSRRWLRQAGDAKFWQQVRDSSRRDAAAGLLHTGVIEARDHN